MSSLLRVPRNRSLKVHILTSPKLGVHLPLVRLQSQHTCFGLWMCPCDHSYFYYIILMGWVHCLSPDLAFRGQEFTDMRTPQSAVPRETSRKEEDFS